MKGEEGVIRVLARILLLLHLIDIGHQGPGLKQKCAFTSEIWSDVWGSLAKKVRWRGVKNQIFKLDYLSYPITLGKPPPQKKTQTNKNNKLTGEIFPCIHAMIKNSTSVWPTSCRNIGQTGQADKCWEKWKVCYIVGTFLKKLTQE